MFKDTCVFSVDRLISDVIVDFLSSLIIEKPVTSLMQWVREDSNTFLAVVANRVDGPIQAHWIQLYVDFFLCNFCGDFWSYEYFVINTMDF